MGGEMRSPPRLPRIPYNSRREFSHSSSRRCQDSDFLPFTFDYQDLPTPGPNVPFDWIEGMPHVAFVSAADSLSIRDEEEDCDDAGSS